MTKKTLFLAVGLLVGVGLFVGVQSGLATDSTLTVLTPINSGGAAYFHAGDIIEIKWSSTGVLGVNLITLNPVDTTLPKVTVWDTTSPTSGFPITASSYGWTVPATVASGYYKVYVQIGVGSGAISNTSDSAIRISGVDSGTPAQLATTTPSITVLTPTQYGSSYFKVGDVMNIQWSSVGVRGVSLITLNPTDSSRAKITILDATDPQIFPLTTDSYSWTVPTTAVTGDYKVYVQIGVGSGAISNTSDATVHISGAAPAQPSLTIVKYSGFGDQTVAPGSPNTELGSFTLSAGPAEGITVTDIHVNLPSASTVAIINLKLMDHLTGTQIGITTFSVSTSNIFATGFNLASSQSKVIDIYADVKSTASGTWRANVSADGAGASTYLSVSAIAVDLQAITASTTPTSRVSPCPPIGDVNGDGIISQADHDLARSFVLGTTAPTAAQKRVADVNGDGVVSSADLELITRYIAGLINTFNACTTPPQSPDSLSFILASTNEDKTGGYTFEPNGHADWGFTATLTLSAAKTIKSMQISANQEVWSTSDRAYYNIAVFRDTTRYNSSYTPTLFAVGSGVTTLKLYAEKWFQTLNPAAKLTVTFTDGTALLATVSIPVAQPSITVLSPNGGETISSSGNFDVAFKPAPGKKHRVNLVNLLADHAYQLVLVGANSDGTITGASTDRQVVSVSIPVVYNIASGNRYKIEVCAESFCDRSDSYFTITASAQPSITVLSPNGGVYSKGQIVPIKWSVTGDNLPATLKISYKLDEPSGENPIADASVNAGSYDWLPPNFSGEIVGRGLQYKIIIRIGDVVRGESNAFSIINSTQAGVSEQVKCIFNGSKGQQKCYAVGPDLAAWFVCDGIGTCTADVSAVTGTKLTWYSICSGSQAQNTTVDGINESVNFNCGTTPPTPSLSASLLSSTDDHAGAWNNFNSGAGNINKDPADWNWTATLTLPSEKSIKSITLAHNTAGEVWSTSYGTDNTWQKTGYPLVVDYNGKQIDYGYDAPFLVTSFAAGTHTFKLYGQKESTTFTGGKLTIVFSDGSQATAPISAAVYGQATPNPVVEPVTVQEQIKCVFKGATTEQKCYIVTNSANSYYGTGCSGVESCTTNVKGTNGDRLVWKSSCGGYAYTVMGGTDEYAIFDCAAATAPATPPVTSVSAESALAQKAADQIADIKEKSKLLTYGGIDYILAELNQLRNLVKEQQTEIKYLKSLVSDVKSISEKAQETINNFITYGVDTNTEKLGAGERAAVMNSYKAAFSKLPETEAELADAIKIANGRFPSVTSDKAEASARAQFVKIYKRQPDMDSANDNAAIKVMAYGLRQKAENRNLNSEQTGIKIFKSIFGKVPNTTQDWNTMQAITYSGATR